MARNATIGNCCLLYGQFPGNITGGNWEVVVSCCGDWIHSRIHWVRRS
jgi:hypothetical protein